MIQGISAPNPYTYALIPMTNRAARNTTQTGTVQNVQVPRAAKQASQTISASQLLRSSQSTKADFIDHDGDGNHVDTKLDVKV